MDKQFPSWTYPAKITEVYDGDSMWIEYDKGHGDYSLKYHRIYQDGGFYFDTPETRKYRGVTEAHKEHGLEAKARAEEMLIGLEGVYVTTYKSGSFRYLAQIWIPQPDGTYRDYADIMKEEGYQKKETYD
jgi:endonuclease YncB( thermonuclease family)